MNLVRHGQNSKAYFVAKRTKKQHSSTTLSFVQYRSVELFQMVRGLSKSGLQEELDYSVIHHDSLAQQFADKISCTHYYLNYMLAGTNSDTAKVPTCPTVWNTFQFIQSVDTNSWKFEAYHQLV